MLKALECLLFFWLNVCGCFCFCFCFRFWCTWFKGSTSQFQDISSIMVHDSMTRRSSVSKMPTPWLTQRPADVTAAALSIRASCKHACCRLPGRLSAEIAPFPGRSRNLRHTIWPQNLKHRWHCCKRMLKDWPKPLLWSPFAKNCEAMWKDSVRSRYCGKGRRAMKTEKVMEKTCSFSPAGPWANNGFALALALCALGFDALGV